MRARATIGECIAALETVWQRHSAVSSHVNNVYNEHMQNNEDWLNTCQKSRNSRSN